MPDSKLARLTAATRAAYQHLTDDDGSRTDDIYLALTRAYKAEGLSEDTAESSIDWYEGGTLVDDLTDAIAASN